MVAFIKTEISDSVVEFRFPDLKQTHLLQIYQMFRDGWNLPEQADLLVSDHRLSLLSRDWEASPTDFEAWVYDFESRLSSVGLADLPDEGQRAIHIVEAAYGGASGPDLGRVANALGIAPAEWVSLHQKTEFVVQFNGFLPGFSYLSGGGNLTRVPRLETPRIRVPMGALAVAGGYCGIYPSESPGGWNVVGQTRLSLFDADADQPSRFLPGDRVMFRAL